LCTHVLTRIVNIQVSSHCEMVLENTVSSHSNASIFTNTERNLRSTAVDVVVAGVVLSVAENKQTYTVTTKIFLHSEILQVLVTLRKYL